MTLAELASDGGTLLRQLADVRNGGEAEFEAIVNAVETWVRAVQAEVNPPGPEGVGADGVGDVAEPLVAEPEAPAEEASAEEVEPEAPVESIEGGTTAETV